MSQITEQTPANNLMLTTIGQLVVEMVNNGANFVKIDLTDVEGAPPSLTLALAVDETAPEFSRIAGEYQDRLGNVVSGTVAPNTGEPDAPPAEPPTVTVRDYGTQREA